jgi:hypothetical protein
MNSTAQSAETKTAAKRNGVEAPINGWFRDNPALDSRTMRVTGTDVDMLWHMFSRADLLAAGDVDLDRIMLIEFKCHRRQPDAPYQGGVKTYAQDDTFDIMRQIDEQLLELPNGKRRVFLVRDNRRNKVNFGGQRYVVHYGLHVWTMSGSTPENSKHMWWDGKPVDLDTMTRVLLYQVDPHALRPIEYENLHWPLSS